MLISYNWLQTYFDKKLPQVEELANLLTMRAFEVEGIEKKGDDSVLDIDVLPNRAHDCFSHYGIAKEVSTLTGIELKKLDELEITWPKSKLLKVSIDDTSLCRRYSGAVISGLKVASSPAWLKEKIEVFGQKSINNIVDATNYVMLSFGQPLHAFDMDKMSKRDGGYHVAVRTSSKDKTITALDDNEYSIGKDDLLIVDGNSDALLGIAGIKGGKKAEVDETTQNIIIESANFESVGIRASSRSLKIRTDASIRFENELTPELTIRGLYEVVTLIKKIAGGNVEGYVDIYPKKRRPYKVGVSLKEVNKLLGSSISESEMVDILGRFGFGYKKVNPIETTVEVIKKQVGTPYKFGASISFDAPNYFDCSSLTSFSYVEAGVSIPRMSIDQYVHSAPVKDGEEHPGDLVFSRTAGGNTYYESIEYMKGTTVKEGISHVGMYIGEGEVAFASGKDGSGKVVIEKLSESPDFKVRRGFRRIMTNNDPRYVVTVPHERFDIRIKQDLIEEIGRVYGYTSIPSVLPHKEVTPPVINKMFFWTQKVKDILYSMKFSEVYTYAFVNSGEVELKNPLAMDKKYLRTNLKDGIEQSLKFNGRNVDFLGLDTIKIFEIGKIFKKDSERMSLSIGVVSPKIKKNNKDEDILKETLLKLKDELPAIDDFTKECSGVVCEIDLERLVEGLPKPKGGELRAVHFEETDDIIYKKISAYPFILRDIAVWIPENVSQKTLLDKVKQESGDLLVRATLFDEYQKNGKNSYAYRLVFQSQEKTLEDGEINTIMEKITKVLNSEKGWEVR